MNKNAILIKSVPGLIESLNNCEKSGYQNVIGNLELNLEDVKKYCIWDNNKYNRNLVYINDSYQLLILCWQQEQYSSIHNYGGKDCFMYVIDGSIQENVYKIKQKKIIDCQENIYRQDSNSYMVDSIGMHSIKCISKQAVTLHIYAKPIEKYHVFDPKENKLICLDYDPN